MTQSLANLTIEQSVEFLANRQVGLRYSCAPPLEKFAQDPADTGGTLAAFMAHPAVAAGLIGAGGGGIIGALAGLRRKKERRNILRDALTGAFAGGLGGVGAGLAYDSYKDQTAPKITAESLGLPATANEWAAYAEKYPDDYANRVVTAAKTLPDNERMRYLQSQGADSEQASPFKHIVTAAKLPYEAGSGYGQMLSRHALGTNPDSDLGTVIDESSGALAGMAATGYGGSLATQGVTRLAGKSPLDLHPDRMTAFGEAMHGSKATLDGNAKGQLTPAAEELTELWTNKMTGVDVDAMTKIKAGMAPGADAAAKQTLSKLLINPQGPAEVQAQKSFKQFLVEVRNKQRAFKPTEGGPATFGNVARADGSLGLRAAAAQRGMGPELGGLGSFGRKQYNIMNNPTAKTKLTARLPNVFKARNLPALLGGAGLFGGGVYGHRQYNAEQAMNVGQDKLHELTQDINAGMDGDK